MSTVLSEIEQLVKGYADARAVVAERLQSLNDLVGRVHRRKLPGIKSAVAAAQEAQSKLSAAIQEHPADFEKPRTHALHGIKFGFKKGVGLISFDDETRVIALIKKHLPEQAEYLIKTTECVIKKALGQLSAIELRKIGCEVEDAGDYIFIKASDSAIDKVVKKLLAEGEVDEVTP